MEARKALSRPEDADALRSSHNSHAPPGQGFPVMEAFFFGPDNQQVFATYHPPVQGGSETLTVICPPLFSDYMRTQLALREIAVSLAEKGQHVLRFDFRGTGDSFGDLAEVAVSDWVEDIAHAVREGREISGSSRVHLLGVRASALLACAAARNSADIQRLVLWDPVPDGAGYLQLLRCKQMMLLQRNDYLSRTERREAAQEYAGYSVSPRTLEGILLLDASTYTGVSKDKLHVVSTSLQAAFPVAGVRQETAPFECEWHTNANELIMSRPLLERLVACLIQS